jgi:hypothetical protein
MKKPYHYIIAFLFFAMACTALKAQHKLLPYRVFFSMSPTLSTGARFENGSSVAATPNITGTHYLHPLFSFLWGRPNPQYTPLQNFARKFNYSLFFEVAVTRRKSITTGFEIGSRGYAIQSDQSDDFIIMYRNINIPLFYTYTVLPGTYWKWNVIAGGAINRASSVPKITYEVFEIKHTPKYYPTVFVGTELSYLHTKGPFTYGVEYHQGFKNVIDHRYFALDYVKGMKIHSSGSHVRLNIKWYFASGFFKLKQKAAKENPDVVKPELDPYGSIIYRTRKTPVLVRVKNPQISICVRDDQTIDGDSVTLELNGLIVARTVALNRTEQCYTIDLSPTGENQLAIHALNLGKIPPNTYEVILYDGDFREVLNLKSDMENSSTINFIVDPNMEHK